MTRARAIRFRPGSVLLCVLTGVLAAAVMLPIVVVVLSSFVNGALLGVSADVWTGGDSAWVSTEAFAYMFRHYGDWITFSLVLAALSVAVCLLIAVPGAYVLACHSFRGSRLVEEIVLLPLSLPGIAMSVALIAAYNAYRGQWLVFGGHLLYTIPFMVRVVASALRGFDVASLETAAASLGAGPWKRLWLVVLPNLTHSLVVGSLLVFAISWGEFNVSYLLNTGTPQTFPAALYDTYANQSIQFSGAATTIFLAVCVPVLLAIQFFGDEDARVEQGA